MYFRTALLSFAIFFSVQAHTQWTTYTTSNSNIPDNLIFDLAVDANNTIWMATGFGAASFDGVSWNIYDVNNSPIDPNSNNDFTAVMVDNNNHVWIAADGAYLYEFDQMGTWTPRGVGFFGDINKMAQDQDGDIWIAHQFGLQEFNGTIWTDHTSQLPTLNALTVEIDADNEVWIGTNQGLVRYDNVSQWTTYDNTPVGDFSNTWIEDIEQGIGNDIWVGTRDGMYRFDQSNSWTLYNSSNSGLLDDQVNSIAVDSDSIVWIANDAGDMSVLQNNIWAPTNLPFNVSFARDIIIDNDGYKWLGCSNALLKLNAQGGGVITLGVEENQTASLIRCFPNPSSGNFTITSDKANLTVELVNPLGQAIWTDIINGQTQVSLANKSASGLYTLRVSDVNGKQQVYKLLIN